MMVKSLFSALILIISISNAFQAQTTWISGTAPEYIGKEISVMSYLDHFTNTLQLEDISTVDSLGNFRLAISSSKIKLVNIRCDYTNAHLYTEPNAIYHVEFPALPRGVSKSINNTARVDMILNDLSEDDINSRIIGFNARYEKFFNQNIKLLAAIAAPGSIISDESMRGSGSSPRSRYTMKLEKFSAEMDSIYPANSDVFFYQYRKSIEADMFQNAFATEREIYDEYIANNTVDIDHPEQINFLSNFYQGYLDKFEKKFGRDILQEALKSENPLKSSLSVLEKDDFLENESLRETVLAMEMHDAWYKKTVNTDVIKQVLQELSSSGQTENSRTLATNILVKVTKNLKGSAAYSFSLKNEAHEIRNLVDFKGEFLVLEFWATWCKSCLTEMKLTNGLKEKYKDRFNFVSISVDENEADVWSYANDNSDLKQEILHVDQDKLILDKFGIRSLPAYVIIDKEGKILYPQAPFPSQVLEATLFKMNAEEENLKKDNFDPTKRK